METERSPNDLRQPRQESPAPTTNPSQAKPDTKGETPSETPRITDWASI